MLQNLRRLIPRPYEATTLQIVRECHSVLGAFVKGQFLVMLLLGVVYAVGLQLIGLEVGLIIGMVAGLASIIPYLGFAVGIIAAVIASLFQFGMDWTHLLLVGVVFMIGQAVEGYILQPFLLGDKIGLSPVAVVFCCFSRGSIGWLFRNVNCITCSGCHCSAFKTPQRKLRTEFILCSIFYIINPRG